MAKIGQLEKRGDVLVGRLETLEHMLNLTVSKNPDKTADQHPDFIVFAKGIAGNNVEVGSGWRKSPNNGGDQFLSMTIDDPSLPQTLNLTAFQTAPNWEQMEITWRRPVARKAAPEAVQQEAA